MSEDLSYFDDVILSAINHNTSIGCNMCMWRLTYTLRFDAEAEVPILWPPYVKTN